MVFLPLTEDVNGDDLRGGGEGGVEGGVIVKAKVATEKRAQEDAVNAAALQKEIEQAEIVKRNQQIQIANQMGYTNAAPPR